MRVSFLLPAYNEAATLREILERVDALDLDKQIVVVDDGSTDETPQILEAWRAEHPDTVVVRQANRGKGAAVRAGIEHIDGDIAVIQDADLEYDPADVPGLIEPIVAGRADVVFGSRLSGGRPQREHRDCWQCSRGSAPRTLLPCRSP
jgi:glycosyltransferase involved in cell wall biosynthesis